MELYMNPLECCTSYATDAGSIVMQSKAQTQHKHIKNKYPSKKNHEKTTNNTKIFFFSV